MIKQTLKIFREVDEVSSNFFQLAEAVMISILITVIFLPHFIATQTHTEACVCVCVYIKNYVAMCGILFEESICSCLLCINATIVH